MQVVTVSPKYQVVIPAALRQALHLKPGQKLAVVATDEGIELRPLRPISDYRGMFPGIDTGVLRDDDRV